MATARRFEELEIWNLARKLSINVYQLTQKEKFSKEFKLKEQIKAASGSVMDNIAEGFERNGTKEFKNFLSISKGSCGEVRSQLYRSFDYNLISESEFAEYHEATEILSRKIASLIRYLKDSELKGSKFNT